VHYSFSTFQQSLSPNNYKEELILIPNFSREQLTYASEVMDKYTHCEDLSVLTTEDVEWISLVLYELAHSYRTQGNLNKAFRYLRENEELYKKTGLKDSFLLAQSYYLYACAHLDQSNWKDAEGCLNEVDRICRLLGDDDREAKSLMLQGWCSFAHVYLESDHDKALGFYNSVLERIDDVIEVSLPSVLISVYQGMATIYNARQDADKTIEAWTKGLETAIKYHGKNSEDAYFFSDQLTNFLYARDPNKRTLQYAKDKLEIALKIFSKDGAEVAASYLLVGHLEIFLQNYTKALTSYKKALKFYEKFPQEYAYVLCDLYFQFVRIYGHQGDSQKASSFLAKADHAFIVTNDGNKENLAQKYYDWALEIRAFENMGEEAKAYLLKALELYKGIEPLNHDNLQEIYGALGFITFGEHNWEKCYEFFKECEKHLSEIQTDPDAFQTLDIYLGAVCVYVKKYDEAEKYIQKILKSSQDVGQIAIAYHNLGNIYEQRGMLRESVGFYKKAIEYEEQNANKSDDNIQFDLGKIAELESKLKEKTEKSQEMAGKISGLLKTFKGPSQK